jgi:hypothetical protein
MSDVQTAAPARSWPRELAAWLAGNNAALAAVIFVVLPNLLFLLISPWILIRRVLSPLLYVLAAIFAVLLPWPFALLAFIVASVFDAFFVVLFMFDMPFGTTLHSIWYFTDIDVTASALYRVAIAYFLAMPVALFVLTRRHRAKLREASLIPATLLAFGVGTFDYATNGFKPIALPPFESATSQNGMTADAIASRGHDLLVVIVEGLGAYRYAEEREILAGRLRKVAAERYRFATGTSNYHGSTTGAEAREFCGEWKTYVDYLDGVDHSCLPAQLAAAGYATASYHASDGALFSRPVWYPGFGFQKLNFREDIERERPQAITRMCGSVFPGMCDSDIGTIIHQDLLASSDKPRLLYWLTLNSHIPYAARADAPLKCRTAEAAIDSPMPCELTEIWMEVFDKVAEIAGDPKIRPIDILVVGDHNTPMWSRDAFRHFISDKVDWYFLEDLRPASADTRDHIPK